MSRPTRLHLFVAATSGLACAGLYVSFREMSLTMSADVLLLSVAAIAVAMLPVELPSGGDISITMALTGAILLLGGPTMLAVVVATASLVPDVRPGKQPIKVVFNVSQLVVSCLISGWLCVSVAARVGVTLPAESLTATSYPGVLIAAAAFAVVFPLVNSTLVGIAITLAEGAPFGRVWVSNFSWHLGTQMALALLGVALAQAMSTLHVLGILVFLVPLVVSRGVFQSYVKLRETYADTIRGLVAAIEAKDPYTRGHSERVSKYSVAIAGAMGLPWTRIEQLELASLLHDLGKIGIGQRILVKPGRLSPDEFAQIRRHPEIGAEIIGAVPFLSGAVPAIVHHHERYDGRGYHTGLSGDTIPMDARILAVADCYDAMTSDRPYKQVLEHSQAVEELRAGSGSQFDPFVVSVFCERVAPTLEACDHRGGGSSSSEE